jgi:hypothetical protein
MPMCSTKSSHSHLVGCFILEKVTSIPIIFFGREALEKVEFYLDRGLICRSNGLWPQLIDLYQWASQTWNPLLK